MLKSLLIAPSSFASWQRILSLVLSVVIVANTGLFGAVVYAQQFEVKLNDFRDHSPIDDHQYGLVNVLVEDQLMQDGTISGDVQDYCNRVQKTLGTTCLITRWQGETPSRIVEALQQMYFEGVEVPGGIAKLVGLVIVGDVPLPVVHHGDEAFPSIFPYTDFVDPAYVYDPAQQFFTRTSVESPLAEIWHGLIRPPGKDQERLDLLHHYFEKNAKFYAGDPDYAVFRDEVGFDDHFWENDAFDNETKRWYLQKMESLDRLMNYRYSGDWLKQLSGEAVDRLAKLTSRVFPDASVKVDKPDVAAVNGELGFDPAKAQSDSNNRAAALSQKNSDIDPYGGKRLSETVPDSYSPGPIRNFLKDYVQVVTRYVSGAAELLDKAGRRQPSQTLASLITTMDKFHSTVLYLVTQQFEQYFYEQAKPLALDFELIDQFDRKNDFYSQELTSAVNSLKGKDETAVGPPPFEEKPKTDPLGYGSKTFHRYVNGVPVELVKTVADCSIERGSNFVSDSGELGRAISLNRKDDPLTAQDISGVSGKKAKDVIKATYRNVGYCSYPVKGQCMPGASRVPLLDYASSEIADVDNDYRRCFDHDGPTVPEAAEHAKFHSVSSLINHDEPTGETVRAMLEKKIAHYFPIDVIRHVSYYLGGAGKLGPENVGRLNYPNFFDLKATDDQAVARETKDYIATQEKNLRRARVEANWKRYEQFLAYSSPVPGRPDFWNYDEITGFDARFKGYRGAVMDLIRPELDPDGTLEDFEVIEKYLIGDSVKPETEQKIQDLLKSYFPTALAHEDTDLKCDYQYDLPPINIDIKIPTVSTDDIQALMNPLAALDVLSRLEVPKFSPPSISRHCSNKIAKATADDIKSLRSFYFSLGGAKVSIGILHKADGFIEVMDPVAVILFFTPVPPPLPPNTNQLAAIELFNKQVEDLKNAPQPADVLQKIVKPVPLLPPGELQPLEDKYQQLLADAVHWLNLSIEGKHKEGLSLLSKDKEMLYLVGDGDAQHLNFNFPNLEGSFKKDEDPSIASRSDLLDEVRNREKALEEKQKELEAKRALQRRLDGEKSSKCGDSVPLIQWPSAVACWLQEIVAGPIIVPAKGEDKKEASTTAASTAAETPAGATPESTVLTPGGEVAEKSGDTSLQGQAGEIALSDKILFIKDRAVASVNLPLNIEVHWNGSGSVHVVADRDGKADVIPDKVGPGTVIASYDDGFGARSVNADVNVVNRHAFLRQDTSGEVQIGSNDALDVIVEVRDQDDNKVKFNGTLQVMPEEDGVFAFDNAVTVKDGEGRFTIHAGKKAKLGGLAAGSDEVARSPLIYINCLAGAPAKIRWDFGDKVVGHDRKIAGQLSVEDQYGNPYRGEGVRVNLVWDPALQINDNSDGQGTFFLVGGQLPITVTVSDQLYTDLENNGFDLLYGYFPTDQYGYSGDFDHPLPTLPQPHLRVDTVDGYPDITLPDEVKLDINPSYRLVFGGIPAAVAVGDSIPVKIQVMNGKAVINLDHAVVKLNAEFAGATQTILVPLHGGSASVKVPAGASAGRMRLFVDDPDFGSLSQEVTIIGQTATTIRLDDTSYENGVVKVAASGRDAYGNIATLKDKIATVRLVGEQAAVLDEKAVVIDGDALDYTVTLDHQPDRVHLEVSIEGFADPLAKELSLKQSLGFDQLKALSWDTPYLMLIGSAFGDYRYDKTVGQAMLFGDASKVQALTTEVVPHTTWMKAAQLWPSGRVTLGPDMKTEVVWQDLKPVMVFSDPDAEVGRLSLNPRGLEFSVQNVPTGDFTWSKAVGSGKAILVPDGTARYEEHGPQSGDILSAEGKKLISFDQSQVVIGDPDVKTAIFDDAGDCLVFEFSLRGEAVARWYLDFHALEIAQGKVAPLQWQFSGASADAYSAEFFYAGESTAGEHGLALYKKGDLQRNDIGRGSRAALDDVRENNGEGFAGEDKVALSFLAGNTVGESTSLQSEGIINLGDPVISLRQTQRKTESGELMPMIDTSAGAAAEDYSIGQLVYAPPDGTISQLLRADVDGDGKDDLAVVIKVGKKSVIRYLQGEGEGHRWGDVTDLLDLGEGVKDVEVLQKHSFAVLYDSGQVMIENNLLGKYTTAMADFSPLGQEHPKIVKIAVKDFDLDGFDDLLFLTGDRQLLIWYGVQTLGGVQFGVQEKDRQLLRVVPVSLKNPDNLKTAAWLMTGKTPPLEVGCREEKFTCQGKYFRPYDGSLGQPQPAQEEDRLQALQDQTKQKPFFEDDKNAPELPQRYLVRLDQLGIYNGDISIKLLNGKEGSQLNLDEVLNFEVTVASNHKEDPFVLRYDLGQDFTLVGDVECQGCNDSLQLNHTPDSLWSLEGKTVAGQTVTLKYSLKYKALPDFSFEVMNTNDDQYPDVGINVASNPSSRITVFESRGPRQYFETIFGEDPPKPVGQPANDAKNLTDLMRGIGVEGKSKDELKQLLLDQQKEIEARSSELFDDVHQDNNLDGYPDAYQENPSLVPAQPLPAKEQKTDAKKVGFLDSFTSYLFPQAKAQAASAQITVLDNTGAMLDDISNDVQLITKALKCSRGCLPLPINFAFLAPGTINIFGEPAGFDPGLPVLGISKVPFFIWPPLVAYQVTDFRLYISPTLTAGLGIGICLGQYLLGQCMVFTIPIQQIAGGEKVCDAVKQGLGFIMQGINTVVGTVTSATSALKNTINSTGVMKAKVSPMSTADTEAILGVSLGGGTHNEGINPVEPKVFLPGIPKVFVDWWDRQWEEIVNSLTDLPDIYVRLPNFKNAFGDRDYWDKLASKVNGDTFLNLQQLYDLVNSLPLINLQAKVLTIQIPWIEPGILHKMEQSLYKFIFDFIIEFIEFLRSFNLPCDITVVREDLYGKLKELVAKGSPSDAQQQIAQLKAQVDAAGNDLKQAEDILKTFTDQKGFSQETVDLRRQYFTQLEEKRTQVKQIEQTAISLQNQLNRLEQPEKITDLLPVFGELITKTTAFWQKQITEFTSAGLKQGLDRETASALRSCGALQVGLNLSADVTGFIDGIKKNIEALQAWKKFPRELAKYLNVLEFYIGEVIKFIDQLTNIVLKWWSEFQKKLDLWIDVILSYQEFIALVKLIIDILKGYNKKCGLCTSDRLTLKMLILKILFGVVPKFPIISFPKWPDIRLDFSDVDLGLNVSLPAFDVRTIDLKWPKLPSIKFPRFKDINLSASGEFSASFSVKLPTIPLVIPKPPTLPPLPPLPDLPQINLPNLPPAPEVPKILESLLPLMKIIQTILDIWCLVNKALIPIDEKVLKTEIENLTNRSLNLILPIDLLLEFEPFSGNLLSKLVPFDLINVKSHFEAGLNIDPLPNLQTTIDEQFHKPMNEFLSQIDQWINQLRNTAQQGLGAMTAPLQQSIDKFGVDANLDVKAGVNAGVDLNKDFPLLNYDPPKRPELSDQLIEQRKQQLLSYHQDVRQGLTKMQASLTQLLAQDPDTMMKSLASLPGDDALVVGTPGALKQEVAQEKREALLDPNNFVDKKITLVDKPRLFAALDQTKNALEQTQEELLGSGTVTAPDLGVAVVRDGQAKRIQDYPLEDPAVAVWDNDVFLGYEKSLYLKSADGSVRAPEPYTGRVLQSTIDTFQRSKVHLLKADSVSSDQVDSGRATIHWSWESPGVTDVELTIWDTVGKAERLDSDHQRFFLHEKTVEQEAYFSTVSKGLTLNEGQETRANGAVRLRFGDDQLIIPAGMTFAIPSLILREVHLAGVGTATLENYSGQPWTVEMNETTALTMNGLSELSVSGPQRLRVPALEQRPVVRKIDGKAEGALQSRVDVLAGEHIPTGEFYATSSSQLTDDFSGATLTLPVGLLFTVTAQDHWTLSRGRGQDVVSADLNYQTGQEGMVLMDDELLRGSFVLDDGATQHQVAPEEQVVWSTIKGPSFDVTLPRANYYGRIREQEGLRGYSPIVHAAADNPRFGSTQVVTGTEEIALPLYAPLTLDAADSVVGSVSNESYHWQLQGDEKPVTGQIYHNPGFDTVADRKLELFIRNGDQDYLGKTFIIKVFLPKLVIDEDAFTGARTIRVQSQPPLAGIPIGIVGERDGVQDWFLSTPVVGSRLDQRYYTDANGTVQLPPLEAIQGLNIVIEAGKKVARLYPTGRVVLNPDYTTACQNEPLLDTDGFLKFRVSCIDQGSLIKKFEVRMIPDRDTDVSIVDDFSSADTGVTIRNLQAALELIPLGPDAAFGAGGVQVRMKGGAVLMLITPDGQIQLVEKNLSIQPKPFTDPAEPLIWQLIQNNSVLVEFTIKGPSTTTIVDPTERAVVSGDANGNGMLDDWEQVYGVSDPNADPDLDNFTNLQEFQAGTNPKNPDTDGDGVPDGDDVNPLDAKVAQRKVTFTDVPAQSAASEAIKALTQMGFIQGYTDGTFKPDQAVTRAEAVKVLMSVIRCENCERPSDDAKKEFDPTLQTEDEFLKFHGGNFTPQSVNPAATGATNSFAFSENDLKSLLPQIDSYYDVKVSDWYYYCVEIATKLGLVHGYRGLEGGESALGKFIPTRSVNVAELAKMVVEAIGQKGKHSTKVYGSADGWWNDPNNNYLATAEEDLQLFSSPDAYKNPLRPATRAEVAYAAYQVLKQNGQLDFDKDGVPNKDDQCPCQAGKPDAQGTPMSCPVAPPPVLNLGPITPRKPEDQFAGIEITQETKCHCLVLVDADLYKGSSFFAVLTGHDAQSDKVIVKSNTVTASP